MLSLLQVQIRFKNTLETGLDSSNGPGMGVYVYAYWARLEESLEDDFPRISKALGPERFSLLVRSYIKRYPSQDASLWRLGEMLPLFLEQSQEWRELNEPRFLSDLARLEWLQMLSRQAPEPEMQDLRTDWAALESLDLEQVVLILHPSVELMSSPFKVHKRGGRGRVNLVIGCQGLDPYLDTIPMDALPFELLSSIRQGESLALLLRHAEKQKISGEQVMTWFSQWVASRVIVGFKD